MVDCVSLRSRGWPPSGTRPSGLCGTCGARVAVCGGLQGQSIQIGRAREHVCGSKSGEVCRSAWRVQKHGGWARGCRSGFVRAALRVAAAGRGNAAIVGIVMTQPVVPSRRHSGVRAGIGCNVELSAVLRRAMVCMVMCAAIVVVAMVRVLEGGECACAALLMCASAARSACRVPASSVAQAAIARVGIPFVLVNGLFLYLEVVKL